MASGYSPVSQHGPAIVMEVREQGAEEQHETQCWGCGLHLVLPYLSSAFKCGWCGAISFASSHNPRHRRWLRCAIFRDRILVGVVLVLIASVTGGGLWAVYPVLFPQPCFSSFTGVLITAVLACSTLYNYCLAAFVPAGSPAKVDWGSVEVVGKGALDGHTYCVYCTCPKPPQAHHCRTCSTCVMDMDHHCPFIGNCVGMNNHGHFILFLIYTLVSSCYVLLMSTLAGLKVWPLLLDIYGARKPRGTMESIGTVLAASFIDAFADSPLYLTTRSLALIYLIIASLAIAIGLVLLLRQQLQLVYEGQTYVESIQTMDEFLKPGWHNLRRIFGNRHPLFWLLPSLSLKSKSYWIKLHTR